jgi:hypothetical protein
MTAKSGDEVLEAALSLPKRERMRIARNLLENIEDEAEPDAGWEGERRLAEVRGGKVKLEDPAVVLKELRTEPAARRKRRATDLRTSSKKQSRRVK